MSERAPLCVRERGGEWHVISPVRKFVPGDWAPIACSATDGIVLPGVPERRIPTCSDCLQRVSGSKP